MKRVIDIVGAGVFLLVLGFPIIVVTVLIKLSSRGPVIFKQERIGKDGSTFTLYKFRSMKSDEKESGVFHDEARVTAIGRFIRKWRIDEIPQMFNVIKGDMSLVGPRPTLTYQVSRYSKEQARRLLVKPGLTGWAQINGDEAVTWPERIDLDLWYVDNWSILLDLRIILLTPFALLKIKDVNVESGPPRDDISDL